VVDDLLLAAESQDDIGSAIAGFWPEVTVRTFEGLAGDPALEMGVSLARVAGSASLENARVASLIGATRIARADDAVLLRMEQDSAVSVVSATTATPGIATEEPFAGRWVLENSACAAFPVADGWAPARFQQALAAAWVAIVPVGAFDVMCAIRKLNIPYYAGELARLAALAEAAGAILANLGDRPPFGTLPPMQGAILPPRAVTFGKRLPIG
jgi:hypothetical protein